MSDENINDTTTTSPSHAPVGSSAPTPSAPAAPPPTTTNPPTLEIVFSKTLALEIPQSEPSSVTSSQSSSPVEILASSTATTTTESSSAATSASSTSSSSLNIPNSATPSLNVKFAPLPELAPRKRKSSVPLGMAARSQLVRRRRGQQHNNHYHDQYRQQDPEPGPQYNAGANPMWTEEELAEARARQVQAAMEKERRRQETAEAGPDDPFVTFASKVKVASKQIWKKVSKKDMKGEKDGVGASGKKSIDVVRDASMDLEGAEPGEGEAVERGLRAESKTSLRDAEHWDLGSDTSGPSSTPGSSTPNSSKPSTPIDAPLRSILLASSPIASSPLPEEPEEEEEGGGVWEEAIDPHFPLNSLQSQSSFDSLSSTVLARGKRRDNWMLDYKPPELELTGITDLHSSSSDDCATPTKAAEADATPMTTPVPGRSTTPTAAGVPPTTPAPATLVAVSS